MAHIAQMKAAEGALQPVRRGCQPGPVPLQHMGLPHAVIGR